MRRPQRGWQMEDRARERLASSWEALAREKMDEAALYLRCAIKIRGGAGRPDLRVINSAGEGVAALPGLHRRGPGGYGR